MTKPPGYPAHLPPPLWHNLLQQAFLVEITSPAHLRYYGYALENCLRSIVAYDHHRFMVTSKPNLGFFNYYDDIRLGHARIFVFHYRKRPVVALDLCLVCPLPHFAAISAAHSHALNGTEPYFAVLGQAIYYLCTLTGAAEPSNQLYPAKPCLPRPVHDRSHFLPRHPPPLPGTRLWPAND